LELDSALNERIWRTVVQQQKQTEALMVGLQKVSAQLAAVSPSGGGFEASGSAPQVTNDP
jgi:hypothetical protein